MIPEPLVLKELTSMSVEWGVWSVYFSELASAVAVHDRLEERSTFIRHLEHLAGLLRSENREGLESFLETLELDFPPDAGWPDIPELPPNGETILWPRLPDPGPPIELSDSLTLEVRGRRIHIVSRTRTQFGRDGKTCDVLLRVNHPEGEESKVIAANRRISRKHFFIEPIPNGVAVVDGSMAESTQRQPSAAGTFLDGEAMDVERLIPEKHSLLTVGQKQASEDVPYWNVAAIDTANSIGYHPALLGAYEEWDGKMAGVWMERQDLIHEDVLLLWTALPLGIWGPGLDDLWILRLHGGFVFFDTEHMRFLHLEELRESPDLFPCPMTILSLDGLTFEDPTEPFKP
jgi:hypothetical protein